MTSVYNEKPGKNTEKHREKNTENVREFIDDALDGKDGICVGCLNHRIKNKRQQKYSDKELLKKVLVGRLE
ncbi:hypothetical protein, partial [Salmonella sp. s54925]|uniref:hypothetical protein n=1 Tax=Salmonella sp. s54925 TaxID=3159674 RepID=UPI00397EE917